MNILDRFLELQRQPALAPALRALEQQVRQRAVACAEAMVGHGAGWEEAAERLGISARTLRGWKATDAAGAAAPLGRPCAAAGPAAQQAVLAELQTVGPGVGVPTLRRQFPELARAELAALTQCYRAVWRTQHERLVHVLHWQRPGTVWAMDFAEAPTLIDGVYPYLLAVRDLASGHQLLWRPVLAPTAAVVRAELTPLFLACGAPWVLKTDNGSAFCAAATRGLLGRWQVFPLFSPPRTPSYNGSIEAAIGALKTRTQRQAEQTDTPWVWSSTAVELARQEANTTARPRRLHGAAPEEVWTTRARLGADERAAFRVTVQQHRQEARRELQLPLAGDLSRPEEAAVDRVALRRALVAHDLLLFTRRRIPARIERPKTAGNG